MTRTITRCLSEALVDRISSVKWTIVGVFLISPLIAKIVIRRLNKKAQLKQIRMLPSINGIALILCP